MGIIKNGRDQTEPDVIVREGREFRAKADFTNYQSDGKIPDSRMTRAGRRPVRRIRHGRD